MHILVVDDNAGVRDVVAALLEDRGYRVSAAEDGRAMRRLLASGPRVDAVVLDAIMPGESSASLAEHLKARGLPMVMISGSRDAIEAAERKRLPLLRKPFSMRQLYAALDQALGDDDLSQRCA
jgi:two-component system OmpR family response regulator